MNIIGSQVPGFQSTISKTIFSILFLGCSVLPHTMRRGHKLELRVPGIYHGIKHELKCNPSFTVLPFSPDYIKWTPKYKSRYGARVRRGISTKRITSLPVNLTFQP